MPESFTKQVMKPLSSSNDEDDDEAETNAGVLFWINKHGFPLDNETWERMWDHAIKKHPHINNVVSNIRRSTLPYIPTPMLAVKAQMSLEKKIIAIQKYIESLHYNYTGTQFFEIKKNRPLCGLMETAKEIIQESLPIKCLEAVILAIYLTNGYRNVVRFALSFNSLFQEVIHRHVVLGIYCNGQYGALGLSRRKELMYKPLIYETLYELIMNFQDSYKEYCHKLLKVRIGLPINHNSCSYDYIIWRATVLNLSKLESEDIEEKIEKHSRIIRKAANQANLKQSSVFLSRAITFPPVQTRRK